MYVYCLFWLYHTDEMNIENSANHRNWVFFEPDFRIVCNAECSRAVKFKLKILWKMEKSRSYVSPPSHLLCHSKTITKRQYSLIIYLSQCMCLWSSSWCVFPSVSMQWKTHNRKMEKQNKRQNLQKKNCVPLFFVVWKFTVQIKI